MSEKVFFAGANERRILCKNAIVCNQSFTTIFDENSCEKIENCGYNIHTKIYTN